MNKPELGQVFTSKVIAEYMVSLFSLDRGSKILDPCFGGGAFIEALLSAGYSNVVGCEIDPEWYSLGQKRFGNIEMVCGDFLQYAPQCSFDGIIMNPPYIRQEKIDELKTLGITKKKLSDNPIFRILPRTANLYMYFVLKGIDLLRENGEMVIIFPSSWIDAKNGSDFKNFLFTNCDITNQIHISGEVFDGDALVEVVILKIHKRKPSGTSKPLHLQVKNGVLSSIAPKAQTHTYNMPKPFSDYASVRRGLTTGNNSAFINPSTSHDLSSCLRPIISSPKDIIGFSTVGARLDSLLSITDDMELNQSVAMYIQEEAARIMATKSPKAMYDKLQHSEKWYKLNLFDCKGIIFSYFVRNEMKFILHQSNMIVRDNFYIISPKIDAYLMFALLNNYFTYYQLEIAGKKYGGGLLKLQRYDIDNLLFPDVSEFTDCEIEQLKKLAQDIVTTGDSAMIDTITSIIAPHVGVNAARINEDYFEIKRHRLENV